MNEDTFSYIAVGGLITWLVYREIQNQKAIAALGAEVNVLRAQTRRKPKGTAEQVIGVVVDVLDGIF